MSASPIAYTAALETPEPDEAEIDRKIDDTMQKIRETTLENGGRPLRSVHAKSHGILIGELTVAGGLPPSLAQGLFATPARYPVIIRLSTTPGDILDDSISTPRGMSIKVIGVQGARVDGSEADTTQDFVLVNAPAFNAPNAGKFLKTLKLLEPTTDKAEPAKKIAAKGLRAAEALVEVFGGKSAALISLGGHPQTNILGESFYSAVPLLFGDYMCKVGVFPVSASLLALTGEKLADPGAPNALRDTVHAYFGTTGAEWEFRVQLCTNLETMPVEDASVAWPEDESPYVTVARLVAQPQDSWNAAKIEAIDDSLAFSPWHALAAHRPIGSVMRARKRAYIHSAQFRHVPPEPISIEDVFPAG